MNGSRSQAPGATVAVIGGGISGLSAAHTLITEQPTLNVIVLEKEPSLGGKLRTVELEGGRVEAGADSFLIRQPHALALAQAAGVDDDLIEPSVFSGLVWDGRKARPLPRDAVMGIPTSPSVIRRARNLTVGGKLRALGDLILPGGIEGDDVAVGPFLRRRFGTQVTHRMVDPILAGTRSGDIDKMSLRYALPDVFARAQEGRSVMRALSSAVGLGPPRFKAPSDGMSSFVARIARSVPLDIRTGSPVESITRLPGGGWSLRLAGRDDLREAVIADAIVVALPAHQAGALFGAPYSPLDRRAVDALCAMPHASVASVALVYRANDIKMPEGSSGFLVPSRSQRTLAAGTWWSKKWPHTAAVGTAIVRCFVGRSDRHPALDLDDTELARRAATEIADITGSGTPVSSRVDRWDNGLPQFELGHHERLMAIQRAFRDARGIEIAGPDLTGSGIPECVKGGTEAALRTLAYLDSLSSEPGQRI